jgi:hypothetical protein
MGLKNFAVAWNVMWALSYIIVAVVAPNISLDTSAFFYAIFGVVLLFCVLVQYLANDTLGRKIVALMLIAFGVFMAYGGVASWTGASLWNVPFTNIEIFQVSMAFANLLSAVFLFYNAIALIKDSA